MVLLLIYMLNSYLEIKQQINNKYQKYGFCVRKLELIFVRMKRQERIFSNLNCRFVENSYLNLFFLYYQIRN